jgi:hypothetical protein
MNKQNKILTTVLVIQIVVLAVVFWPSSSAFGGERLFGELSADQIVRLTIHDASGNRIVLAQDAGKWVLPEAGDFPVQEDLVGPLLDKIVEIRGDRLVTQTSGSHERLGVAAQAFERLIEFELADGGEHKLYLGTAPNYQVLHVRADDEDAVYLALGMTVYEARAEVTAWIDPVYFSVPADQIVALTLENSNGRFEFAQDEAGAWTMKGLAADETLSQNNVRSLANRFGSMRMQRPLGRDEQASYGFDAPSATVTLEAQQDEEIKTYVLRVGASLEGEGGYVVKSATSPYYVLMADYSVDDLLEKTRQDWIELPPTPEP